MFHNVLRYRNQILITICGYVGHLLCGYGISWTAPIIPKMENPDESPLSRPLSDIEMSLLASVLYIAGLPAVLSMSWFSNFKGRKASYVLSAIFYIIGFAMLGSATNFTMMFIARIINTFGFSIANMINTIYIGEIASSNIRGIFLTGLGVIQTLGSLILFSVGPFVSYSMVSYIGVAISIVYFLAVLCIPESPVYLALKGFGVIPSTLTGELFNSNVRSKGTASVFVVSWISGFIITTIFNTLISSIGAYAVFWFFSFTCGLAFLFTLFFIPETKGKSLIEIQEMLSK